MSSSISELLTCSICYESYTSNGDRIPYLLSCGHTFCIKDLKILGGNINNNNNIRNRLVPAADPFNDIPDIDDSDFFNNHNNNAIHAQVRCPTCRVETSLPHDIPCESVLKRNYALLAIMEQHAEEKKQAATTSISSASSLKHSSNQSSTCGVCDGHVAATVWCNRCDSFFCDTHDTSEHLTVTASRHQRIPASDHRPLPMCTAHGEACRLYCTESGCEHLVCSTCALAGDHKGHDFIEPAVAWEQKKQQLSTAITQRRAELDQMGRIQGVIHQTMAAVQQASTKAITQVQARYAAMRAELNKNEADFLQQITANDKSLLLDLSAKDAQISGTAASLESSLAQVSTLIVIGRHTSALLSLAAIASDVSGVSASVALKSQEPSNLPTPPRAAGSISFFSTAVSASGSGSTSTPSVATPDPSTSRSASAAVTLVLHPHMSVPAPRLAPIQWNDTNLTLKMGAVAWGLTSSLKRTIVRSNLSKVCDVAQKLINDTENEWIDNFVSDEFTSVLLTPNQLTVLQQELKTFFSTESDWKEWLQWDQMQNFFIFADKLETMVGTHVINLQKEFATEVMNFAISVMRKLKQDARQISSQMISISEKFANKVHQFELELQIRKSSPPRAR